MDDAVPAVKTPTIGIVAEGASDQVVLQFILAGYFGDTDIDPNPLQPLRDATGRFESSGWSLVLEYCASENFRRAFVNNEYIIIQIDTDVSEKHPSYGVPHQDANGPLSCEKLVEAVCAKLVDKIGAEFYEQHKDRIIFAVSVHSLECWLLPLHWDDKRRGRIENCLNCLNEQLAKQGYTIHDKDSARYRRAAKDYAKPRVLKERWHQNPSLKIFVDNLEQRFQRGFTLSDTT